MIYSQLVMCVYYNYVHLLKWKYERLQIECIFVLSLLPGKCEFNVIQALWLNTHFSALLQEQGM